MNFVDPFDAPQMAQKPMREPQGADDAGGFIDPFDAPLQQQRPTMSPQDAALMSHPVMPEPQLPELPLAKTTLDNPHLARTPGGQLNMLRRTYPNAELTYGEDGEPQFILNEPNLGNPSQRYILNAKGPSKQDLALFEADALRAMPAIGAGMATGGMGAIPAMVAAGVGGFVGDSAVQGAANLLGADEPYSVTDALMTGAWTAAGEGVARIVAKAIGGAANAFRKMMQNRVDVSVLITQDGQLTKRGMEELTKRGIGADDFRRMIQREVAENADESLRAFDNLTPAQQDRMARFRAAGFVDDAAPTKAQITRDISDFLDEQSLERQNVPELINRKLAQNQQLTNEVQGVAARTGGQAAGKEVRGESVIGALQTKDRVLSRAVDRLYARAAMEAGENAPVDMTTFVNRLPDLNIEDRAGNSHFTDAARQQLQEWGVINANGEVVNPLTIVQAEALRKRLNRWHATGRNDYVVGQMKDALDEAVITSVGDDVFGAARGAARARFAELHTPQGARKVVADIVSGKIQAADVMQRAVFNSKTSTELNNLRQSLVTGSRAQTTRGTIAWNNIRRETVDFMYEQATKNTALNEAGVREFSGDAFAKAWAKISPEKRAILFTKDEITALNNIADVGVLRMPPPRGRTGSTTSDNMFRKLGKLLERTPIAGKYVAGIKEVGKLGETRVKVQTVLNPPQAVNDPAKAALIQALQNAGRPAAMGAGMAGNELFYPVTGRKQ